MVIRYLINRKSFLFIITLVVIVVSAFIVKFMWSGFSEKARNSYYSSSGMTVVTAMRLYRETFGKYCNNIEDLGSAGKISGYKNETVRMYFDAKDLPKEIKSNLPEEAIPFVGESGFRLLYVVDKDLKQEFIVFDEKGNKKFY